MSNNEVDFVLLSTPFWAFLLLFSLLGVVLFALTFRRRSTVTVIKRVERSVGLAVPDDLRPLVGRRLLHRRRYSLTGTVLGTWAAVPALWMAGGPESSGLSTRILLLVGATFAGGAVGTAVGSFWSPIRSGDETMRYARPRAVEIGDYIARFERRGAWVIVALATLTYFASVTLSLSGLISVALLPPATIGGVMVLFAVISLGLFELVGRRIVGRAQPAGSEMELVWDDQMRSADVRGLMMGPLMLGFYGTVICSIDLALPLSQLVGQTIGLIAVNIAAYVGFIIIFLAGIFAIVSRPDRFFLRRLWPQYSDLGAPLAAQPAADTAGSDT